MGSIENKKHRHGRLQRLLFMSWNRSVILVLLLIFCGIFFLTLMGGVPTIDGQPHPHSTIAVSFGGKSAKQVLSERVDSLQGTVSELQETVRVLQLRAIQENLEPELNYRKMFMLGKVSDVEDRSHIEPYFLGHYVNTTAARRRVYVDLGVKEWPTSIGYMLQKYPAHFDEVYGFECCTPAPPSISDVDLGALLTAATNKEVYTVPEVQAMTKVKLGYIGGEDDPTTTPPHLSVHTILKGLNLTPEDFVVVKMDIEHQEYAGIKALLADPVHRMIDEMFVEVHYHHKDMQAFGWDTFSSSLPEAQVLFQKLRSAGIVTHPWP